MVTLHPSNSAGRLLGRTPLAAALLCAGLLGAAPAYAATITVDSILDTTGNATICTLRDAITAANTNVAVGGCVSGTAGPDTIFFNIPGLGVHTIVVSSVLPQINEPILINGYSQPGSVANSIASAYPAGAAIDAQPMIEIDGNGLPGVGSFGLFQVNQTANNSIFTGLSVGNFLGVSAFFLAGKATLNGNFIGVRADGTTAFPNNFDIQVMATAQTSHVGSGGSPAQRNLIGGQVYIDAANVTIIGNLLGTDKSGTTVVGTVVGGGSFTLGSASGQAIVSNNVINYGSTNVFAPGIYLTGVSNTNISSNLIGVGVSGTVLGNTEGIEINNANGVASNNVIVNNTIANSKSDGILVLDVTGFGGLSGNQLDFNSIYGNGGLGINLQVNGEANSTVTNNDANDADSGPNGLQNFPVITSAKANAGGGIDIAFTLNSTPNGLFNITAYSNLACNASGQGEGRYDSGTQTAVATDPSGNGAGTFTVAAPLPTGWGVGQVVALLARDSTTKDTSEFSACATVVPSGAINQPPVAVNDSYATPFNTTLTVAANGVLANDSDPDGNTITAVFNAGPSHGALLFPGDGSFVYTPNPGWSGPDSFTYNAFDGTLSSASLATVSITVAANNPPVAVNDSYSTPLNTTLTVAANGVLANDSDPDGNPITAVISNYPSHGTLTLNANGGFVYIPTAGYSGPDAFAYFANDGWLNSAPAASVLITVGAAINTPPIAANDSYSVASGNALNLTVAAPGVLVNDSDPDGNPITAVLGAAPSHGTLMLNANGSFTYTPAAGFSGVDSFSYYANDGTLNSTSAATVSLAVSGVVITPPEPTPPIVALTIPPGCGLSTYPVIVNLSLEEGPTFATDMVSILSTTLGQSLVYLEQSACGTVTLGGFNGGKLAFIPHTFQSDDARANGIYPMGNGQYQVVRNTQSLVIAPALVHVEQLTALLPGAAAKQVDNGVMTATVNGLTYVVQASAAVQLGAATGAGQLLLGGDGLFHFIDTLGHNQVLYPAFADPATLRGALLGLDPNATLNIGLDGKASIVLNGQHYTLVPDLTLGAIPAEKVGLTWWQESATRYRVINAQVLGTSQGFTVTP